MSAAIIETYTVRRLKTPGVNRSFRIMCPASALPLVIGSLPVGEYKVTPKTQQPLRSESEPMSETWRHHGGAFGFGRAVVAEKFGTDKKDLK